MGPAIFGLKKELPHGICLEPAELTPARGGDTSDGMTNMRKYLYINFRSPHASLGLTPRCAMRDSRAWGISSISRRTTRRTHLRPTCSPPLFWQFASVPMKPTLASPVMVPTYSPNCLTSVDVPIQGGSPICCISPPTLGSYTDAALVTWGVGSISFRESEGVGPSVFTSDVDRGPWHWAPLHSIGASGFSAKQNHPSNYGHPNETSTPCSTRV